MGGSGAGHFRITLSMKREPNAEPVFCKMESSNRFKQLKTIKLCADAVYRLDISFKPPQVLQALEIGGRKVKLVERARDGTACAYSARHSTRNAKVSQRGQREELPIAMRVLGSGNLTTALQIKYYRSGDSDRSVHGSKLHCVELDCSNVEARIAQIAESSERRGSFAQRRSRTRFSTSSFQRWSLPSTSQSDGSLHFKKPIADRKYSSSSAQ